MPVSGGCSLLFQQDREVFRSSESCSQIGELFCVCPLLSQCLILFRTQFGSCQVLKSQLPTKHARIKTHKNRTSYSHLPCSIFKAIGNFTDTTENVQVLNSNPHNLGKLSKVSGAKKHTTLEFCVVSHVLGKDLGVAVSATKHQPVKGVEWQIKQHWTNGNGFKAKESKVALDVRKKFFPARMVGHGNQLSREAVDALSMEVSKARLEGLRPSWSPLRCPCPQDTFQSKPIHDSITPSRV